MFEPGSDEAERFGPALDELLDSDAYEAARRSTLNAHYTTPEVASALWASIEAAGFNAGNVLEAGCGTGVFMATAPEGADITGVELDPTTAAVCQALHPGQRVVSADFTDFYESEFDVMIGNVPFSEVPPFDAIYNRGNQRDSLHNYFIRKGLHLLRPGGLLVVLTSRYTLDAADPESRCRMAALGRFLGAARLPNTAFERHAGTRVVTDVVMFQRRDIKEAQIDTARRRIERDDGAPELAGWGQSPGRHMEGAFVNMSEWYDDNPDLILGRLEIRDRGMYGRNELSVEGTHADHDTLADRLRIALVDTISQARPAPLPPVRADLSGIVRSQPPAEAYDPQRPWLKQGSIILDPSSASGFSRIVGHSTEPHDCPRSRVGQLRAALSVRDGVLSLLAAEADSDRTDAEIAQLRSSLGRAYQRYQSRYGYLNEGRVLSEEGERRGRSSQLALAKFTADPDYPTVLALENYDPDTGTVSRADIFERRVVRASEPPRIESLSDAALAAMRTDATIDADAYRELAQGAGLDAGDLADEGLAYRDPALPGTWIAAPHYLSGDIASKIDAAFDAARDDESFQVNVDALKEVLPPQADTSDIHLRLGAAWVPAPDLEDFAMSLVGRFCDGVIVTHTDAGGWNVEYDKLDTAASARSPWGTPAKRCETIFRDILAGKYQRIQRRDPDGSTYIDFAATEELHNKIEDWHAEFQRWAFEDDAERATRLLSIYNRTFRSWVRLQPDPASISLDRLRDGLVLRDSQINAVARMVHGGDMLLGHAVGAGKTITMGLAALELKRLGHVNKPAVVCPNHLTAQFAAEVAWAFPTAKVLARHPGSATQKQRQEFLMRCATGDWDLVILPYSFFETLRQPPQVEQMHYEDELHEITLALTAVSSSGSRSSVKQLEKAKERARTKAAEAKEAINARTDPTYDFAALGIDWIAVDEAHHYKNHPVHSANSKLAYPGAPIAIKFAACLRTLRYLYPDHKSHVTLATGTPVANKVSELWAMQRYVQPDALRAAGVYRFDAWAAQFGKVVTAIEYNPVQKTYRPTARFAEYVNIPDVMRLVNLNADIKVAADLKLPTPPLRNGERDIISVPATDTLDAYMEDIAKRVETLPTVEPTEDNILKVMTDARKAALHLGLVDEEQPEPSKIAVCANEIASIYHLHAAEDLIDPATGEADPLPGRLQMVFCDMGVPGGQSAHNVYSDLIAALESRGVPAAMIETVHAHGDGDAKLDLFRRCNTGEVAVVIGSSEKMATGVNAQRRLVALHHLDAPWRPADIEQREGRILRSGNLCDEVRVVRYVCEGSFDVFMWQTLETKHRFITQMLSGRADHLSTIPDDEQQLQMDYHTVKAIATGDPRILEREELSQQAAKLERQRQAYERDQWRLRTIVSSAERDIPARAERIEALAEVPAPPKPGSGVVINGIHYPKLTDADVALSDMIKSSGADCMSPYHYHHRDDGPAPVAELGTFAGAKLYGSYRMRDLTLWRHSVEAGLVVRVQHSYNRFDGLARALLGAARGRDTLIDRLELANDRSAAELDESRPLLNQPWRHQTKLTEIHQRMADIEEELRVEAKAATPEPDAYEPDDVGSPNGYSPAVELADYQMGDEHSDLDDVMQL